jgi:hypothetical protein
VRQFGTSLEIIADMAPCGNDAMTFILIAVVMTSGHLIFQFIVAVGIMSYLINNRHTWRSLAIGVYLNLK